MHVRPSRVAKRHAQDLLVRAFLVTHHKHAHRANLDPAARERRLAHEDERIERVAVATESALDEAVVGRVPRCGEQHPIEVDLAGRGVHLVLVPRAPGDLDHDDRGRGIHPGTIRDTAGDGRHIDLTLGSITNLITMRVFLRGGSWDRLPGHREGDGCSIPTSYSQITLCSRWWRLGVG